MLKATSLPWLVLVPDSDKTEVFELPASEQQQLMENSSALSAFIKKTYAADKINIASIGNIVSQLHVHVIGRYRDDACWPGVAWGVKDDRPNPIDHAEITAALQDWFGGSFRPGS